MLRTLLLLSMVCMLSATLYAENLVANGDFSAGAAGWTIVVPDTQAAFIDVNAIYLGDAPQMAAAPCVRVQSNDPNGTKTRARIYQPITLVAGETYRVSTATKILDITSPEGPDANLKTWVQAYITKDEPADSTVDNWNPSNVGDGKVLNVMPWGNTYYGVNATVFKDMIGADGLLENMSGGSDQEANDALFVVPTDDVNVAGTELTYYITLKPGASSGGTFDVLMDNVAVYNINDNILVNGDFEAGDAAWTLITHNQDGEHELIAMDVIDPNGAGPSKGAGNCLQIKTLEDQQQPRPVIYQKVTLKAGETYQVSAALKINDLHGDTPPGFWCQIYMASEEPPTRDPAGTFDWNPSEKLFNLMKWSNSWNGVGVESIADFVGADGFLEHFSGSQDIGHGAMYTVPVDDVNQPAGSDVDIWVVFKPGSWNGDGGGFDIMVDNIAVYPVAAQEEAPIISVTAGESLVATGDDGEITEINGMAVSDLTLATVTADYEKFEDWPAANAENFLLNPYASLDDASEIIMMFPEATQVIYIVERGSNDEGLLQALDQDGVPFGAVVPFEKSDWYKTGYKINGNQEAGLIVLTTSEPIFGVRVIPKEGKNMGLDPTSVSAQIGRI